MEFLCSVLRSTEYPLPVGVCHEENGEKERIQGQLAVHTIWLLALSKCAVSWLRML